MDDKEYDANGLPDMPSAFLRQLADCLWEDGKDLARLNCTCKGLRSVCGEPALWQQLVFKRFGRSVVPGMRPEAGQTRPLALPGWVFYQGRDASEESDQQHSDFDGTDLQHFAQQRQGADAFTTSGKVIYMLHKPQAAWKHFSFSPKAGMYVKESVVAEKRLLPPQQQDAGDAPWPPEVAGWIYFPSCSSEGYAADRGEPKDVLPRYQRLTDVLEFARNHPTVVAVTTSGELKSQLRSQACWKVDPSYDIGLFVKARVVQEMQLMQPPQVPDYRALYAKLDMLRLDASQMWAVWLNDMYLELVHDNSSPTDSGMLLHLKSVWWLDVGGSVHGVPPGDYEVCWVVNATDGTFSRNTKFSVSAEAVAAHPAALANTGNSGTSSSSNAQDSEQPNSVTVQYTGAVINELWEKCTRQSAKWGVISGGILHVDKFSTVKLRFWSHDNTYKQNMYWAYVDLKPLSRSQLQQAGSSSQQAPVRALPQLKRPGSSGAERAPPRAAHTLNAARGNTTMPGHGQQQQGVPVYPEMGPMGGVARWFMAVLGGMQGQPE